MPRPPEFTLITLAVSPSGYHIFKDKGMVLCKKFQNFVVTGEAWVGQEAILKKTNNQVFLQLFSQRN